VFDTTSTVRAARPRGFPALITVAATRYRPGDRSSTGSATWATLRVGSGVSVAACRPTAGL